MPSLESCSIQSAAKAGVGAHATSGKSPVQARRRVARAVLGLEEENCHLGPRHGAAGAVVTAAAAAGDGFRVELLDPVDGKGGRGRACDVVENARAGGRRVGGAVLGLQQEDGHLGAGHRIVAAVVAAAASRGDAVSEDLLDVGVEDVRLGHVEEIGEERADENAREGRTAHRVRYRDVVQPSRRKRRREGRDLRRADDGHAVCRSAADPGAGDCRKAASRDGHGRAARRGAGGRRDARHGRRHSRGSGQRRRRFPRTLLVAWCRTGCPRHRR